VDEEARPGAGAFAVHEANETRVPDRRPDALFGLPEQEAVGLDDDLWASPIDQLRRVFRWGNEVFLGETAPVEPPDV